MTRPFLTLGAAALAALGACGATDSGGAASNGSQVSRFSQIAPPGAEPGTCWGKHTSPAVIETVTHQTVVQAAELNEDGSVARPAVYKTETRQEIVRDRKETWFETPCATEMTPEFIASVQRALSARGLYRGPVTGRMDNRTRAAIRRYQEPEGLDSGTLSLASARSLGLVAIERDPVS